MKKIVKMLTVSLLPVMLFARNKITGPDKTSGEALSFAIPAYPAISG
ncbi:MAG TPA: hypothetical protein VJ111_12685 [Chitinophagaceae bacterium]|nr:hypothetical protein [Chitinophagaceae bacterium]